MNIVNKVLSEEISNSTKNIKKQLLENKGMCSECGGKIYEGECMECGSMTEGDIQELGGMEDGHPRFGNKKLPKKMSIEDIERILRGDNEEDFEPMYYHKDSRTKDMLDKIKSDRLTRNYGDNDEWEEIEEDECVECGDTYETEIDEKLYGKQSNIDKNKNGKIDKEDFKMLRKEGVVTEKWKGDVEVEKTGEHTKKTIEEINSEIKKLKEKSKKYQEDGKKVPMKLREKLSELYFAKRAKKDDWSGKVKVKESKVYFTEDELVDIIESIVIEEQKKNKKEVSAQNTLKSSLSKSKTENDDNLKSVAKKMKDYLKDASKGKYEENPTNFPESNYDLENRKEKIKKYTPSDAVDEYIDAFSYPGMTNLVYDEIKPNEERIEKYLKGDSTTGNAVVDKDGKPLGNVVPSEVGEKFLKNYKDNLYGQEQMTASYKRVPQPVDTAGEDTESGTLKTKKGKKTAQDVLNAVEESVENKKVISEMNKMKNLMGYKDKTQ